jgi:hypothetical protein
MAWAVGGTVFAATMMVLLGALHVLQGISLLAKDNVFVIQSSNNYTYAINRTGWGWVHIIGGGLVVLTGAALFTSATWAKIVGIGLVVLSAVANFLFLPFYPVWSIVLIGIDVFAIWALATALSESRRMQQAAEAITSGEAVAYDRAYAEQRWAATNPEAGYRSTDAEAARRASDMATPSTGARHAMSEEEQRAMSGTRAGGTQQTPGTGQGGTGQPGGYQEPGMPPPGTYGGEPMGGAQQPRPPMPPGDAT